MQRVVFGTQNVSRKRGSAVGAVGAVGFLWGRDPGSAAVVDALVFVPVADGGVGLAADGVRLPEAGALGAAAGLDELVADGVGGGAGGQVLGFGQEGGERRDGGVVGGQGRQEVGDGARELLKDAFGGGADGPCPEDGAFELRALDAQVAVVVGEQDAADVEAEGGVAERRRHRVVERLGLQRADSGHVVDSSIGEGETTRGGGTRTVRPA
jgi:hypothetical protein